MFGFEKLRQKKEPDRPFPGDWQQIIDQKVPYYRCLTADKQDDLRRRTRLIISEKRFEGCGGLELTDEIRVMIAAQAAILVLGGEDEMYPDLRSILVYPHDYYANVKQTSADGVVTEGVQKRAGESWTRGNVVLAWDDVQHGAADSRDGQNLVFHEFAHQIDRSYGATANVDAPSAKNKEYQTWARVLRASYQALVEDLQAGRATLLDPYGATNMAEFFAVATECFFELPRELRRTHPALYDQFKIFYRQDPAGYFEDSQGGLNKEG